MIAAHLAALLALFAWGQAAPVVDKRSYFVNCTYTQNQALQKAVIGAQTISNLARSYTSSLDGDTPRYDTWFGNYTEERASEVTSHFESLVGGAFLSATFDCSGCPSGAGLPDAVVNIFNPGVVYPCDSFFDASLYGANSQSGALIEALLQFPENGGLGMYGIEESEAKELAQGAPDQAIQNAPSYRFYAENADDLS
ncbi:peptidyl-Lys metalloendopeptidase [Pseudohyphozyma bogoriensis]|nr:peptidyl-Lys metalloendopeptidase [Pseudohyphozyma bogoriensis]